VETKTQSASSASADAGGAIAISTPNPESEARLRAFVTERGAGARIRLVAPADADVSGHQMDATSLNLRVVDEDDTEGHAISLHFPTAEDAKQFERRMIATGAIVGTLVLAGGGLALTQTLPDAGGSVQTQAQVQTVGTHASTAGTMTGKQEALLEQMAGVDVIDTGASQALTGKQEALLNELKGPNAVDTSVSQAGPSAGDLTGKEAGVLEELTGDADR
jgi:hypothetical protein